MASLYSYTFAGGASVAFLGIPRVTNPVYVDLKILTYASDCSASFWELLKNVKNCYTWTALFNYTSPSLWLLRFFHFDASNSNILAASLGLLAIISVLAFIFTFTSAVSASLLLGSLFLLSFPFQLATERGNYDLFILILCLLIPLFALNFFSSSTPYYWLYGMIACLLSFAVTALKIYPITGIIPWSLTLLLRKSAFNRGWAPLLLIFAATVGIACQFDEIAQVLANTPKPDGELSFGLLASYSSKFGRTGAFIITMFKLLIIYFTCKFLASNDPRDLFLPRSLETRDIMTIQYSVFFSVMMCSIYFLSRSWDYRLIFGIGICPFFVNKFLECTGRVKNILLSMLSLCAFVVYEQYVPGRVGSILHLASDAVAQPVLIGFLLIFLLFCCNYRLNIASAELINTKSSA